MHGSPRRLTNKQLHASITAVCGCDHKLQSSPVFSPVKSTEKSRKTYILHGSTLTLPRILLTSKYSCMEVMNRSLTYNSLLKQHLWVAAFGFSTRFPCTLWLKIDRKAYKKAINFTEVRLPCPEYSLTDITHAWNPYKTHSETVSCQHSGCGWLRSPVLVVSRVRPG